MLKKQYKMCCAWKSQGVNYFEIAPNPNKCSALTTRPDVKENAKKTGNFLILEYVDADD